MMSIKPLLLEAMQCANTKGDVHAFVSCAVLLLSSSPGSGTIWILTSMWSLTVLTLSVAARRPATGNVESIS